MVFGNRRTILFNLAIFYINLCQIFFFQRWMDHNDFIYSFIHFKYLLNSISQFQICILFSFLQVLVNDSWGLIAYKNARIKNKYVSNILSFLAIFFILLIACKIDQDSFYPGYWSLIPTFGAGLIILSSKQAFINKYLLSNKLIIFIGKISYPLYLWHWPLLVYSRMLYQAGSSSLFSNPFYIIILLIFVSIFTQYFIQNPLRYSKSVKQFYCMIIVMIIIVMFAYHMAIYPEIFSKLDLQIQFFLENENNNGFQSLTKIQQKNFNQIKNNKELLKNKNQNNVSLTKNEKKMIVHNITNKAKNFKKQIIKFTKYQCFHHHKMINIKKLTRMEKKIKLLNSSKNRKRLTPTRNKLLYYHRLPFLPQQALQRVVDRKSKYFDQKLIKYLYQIVNEPRDWQKRNKINNVKEQNKEQQPRKLVIIMGDSHCRMISPRFMKLYNEYKQQNKSHQFPTVISIGRGGKPPIPCHQFIDLSFDFIKKHKPDRLLFIYDWIKYLQYQEGIKKYGTIKKTMFWHIYNELWKAKFKRCSILCGIFCQTGIQVNVMTISPQGPQFQSQVMFDMNNVIQSTLKPIKLNLLQKPLKQFNVNLVDLADHQYWNDICQKFVPNGFTIFKDSNHYAELYAKYWASSVDFLVKF